MRDVCLGLGLVDGGGGRGKSVPRVRVGSTLYYIGHNCFGENEVVHDGAVFCGRNIGLQVILESAVTYDEGVWVQKVE